MAVFHRPVSSHCPDLRSRCVGCTWYFVAETMQISLRFRARCFSNHCSSLPHCLVNKPYIVRLKLVVLLREASKYRRVHEVSSAGRRAHPDCNGGLFQFIQGFLLGLLRHVHGTQIPGWRRRRTWCIEYMRNYKGRSL